MKMLAQTFISAFIYAALYSSIAENTQIQQTTSHPIYPGINQPPPSQHVVSGSNDGVIDTYSLLCLGCHDGINATEARIMTDEEWGGFDISEFSHPIGIDYDKALSRNSGLIPEAFLPLDIILPEGKVGCQSCHNLNSALPYFLVFSNQGSALCLSCHIR